MASKNVRKIPAALRRQVCFAAGMCCCLCRKTTNLEIAHIVPFSTVRKHEYDNLLLLCGEHHNEFDTKFARETDFVRGLALHPSSVRECSGFDPNRELREFRITLSVLPNSLLPLATYNGTVNPPPDLSALYNRLRYCLASTYSVEPGLVRILSMRRRRNGRGKIVCRLPRNTPVLMNSYSRLELEVEDVEGYCAVLGTSSIPRWAQHTIYGRRVFVEASTFLEYLRSRSHFGENVKKSLVPITIFSGKPPVTSTRMLHLVLNWLTKGERFAAGPRPVHGSYGTATASLSATLGTLATSIGLRCPASEPVEFVTTSGRTQECQADLYVMSTIAEAVASKSEVLLTADSRFLQPSVRDYADNMFKLKIFHILGRTA